MPAATRRAAIAALTLACAAAGCGAAGTPHPRAAPSHPARYEPAVKATFLRTCKAAAGGARSVDVRCECVLSRLEASASQATLRDTERALAKGEAKVPEWMIAAASACNGR